MHASLTNCRKNRKVKIHNIVFEFIYCRDDQRFWVTLRLIINKSRGFMPQWISRHVPKLRISGYVTLFYSHVFMACKVSVVTCRLCYMLILVTDCRGIKTPLSKSKEQINSGNSYYNSVNINNEITCLNFQQQYQAIFHKKLCTCDWFLSCFDLGGY